MLIIALCPRVEASEKQSCANNCTSKSVGTWAKLLLAKECPVPHYLLLIALLSNCWQTIKTLDDFPIPRDNKEASQNS